MILQSLAHYYDILVEERSENDEVEIPLPGFSIANVSYALNLSLQGELTEIVPLYKIVQRGKKSYPNPQRMIVPEQPGRSGKTPPPYFLCDNNAYFLGISGEDQTKPNFSRQRFEAFRKFNIEILAKADCCEAHAVISFLENYNPTIGIQHPEIVRNMDEIMKGGKLNFVFLINGEFAHNNPTILNAWEIHYQASSKEYFGQCLVTGERAPIARLHDIKIKGIPPHEGGVTLVGFNKHAYESFNRIDQDGLNSPVSKKAMLAYSKALNYLLSEDNHNFKIGNTTVVFWADSKNKAYTNFFASIFESDTGEFEANHSVKDNLDEDLLRDVAIKVKQGHPVDEKSLFKEIDGDTQFYVLGIYAPNQGRAAIRFFHTDPFRKTVQRITQHYSDLRIGTDENQMMISPGRIIKETVSKKTKKQEPAPLLIGELFQAILTNSLYPAELYYAIINRIRADMDDEKEKITKINHLRASVIKAFLLRKYRNQPKHIFQEVLQMSLNKQTNLPAYVLGRLFAVLEKAQKDAAAPKKLNSTIKDRFFTSACASPASVFPVLLRLAQHHISKEDKFRNDDRIEEILDLLEVKENPIPTHLTLDEQGVFVLGYYHQRADLYLPRKDKPAGEPSIAETSSTELDQSNRG